MKFADSKKFYDIYSLNFVLNYEFEKDYLLSIIKLEDIFPHQYESIMLKITSKRRCAVTSLYCFFILLAFGIIFGLIGYGIQQIP
jgi:hypothetical protein